MTRETQGTWIGNKWKLVHFPLCSLPWINDATIWAAFVVFFPSYVQLVHFLRNKMAASRWRHSLNFISLQNVKLLNWVYRFWFVFIQNISVVKPANLSGFVSRLYAEQCILLSDCRCPNWICTPLHTSLVISQQKSVPLFPKGKILFLKFTL